MLTSEVELALFDCVEMRRRLSKQLWCELHGRKGKKTLIGNFQAQITPLFCSATYANHAATAPVLYSVRSINFSVTLCSLLLLQLLRA
jgi:hypothetical protein